MAAEKTYKAAIIGCGRIASTLDEEMNKYLSFFLLPYTHAGAYRATSRVELVAGADTNPASLAAFGRKWGISSLYADYKRMLEREKPDIVSVAVSSPLHHQVVMDLAEFPIKGIFLEKPVARSLEEADQMIEACRKKNIRVAVNHVRTFDPYYHAARDMIEHGEIGTLKSVMSTWREGLSFGGSHLFDLLRFISRSEVEWVFAHLDDDKALKDPGGDAYLVYKSGLRVHVHMPFQTAMQSAVEMIGSAGRIRMDFYNYRLWKVREVDGVSRTIECPFPGCNDGKSGMRVAIEELMGAIENGTPISSTLEDGRKGLEVILALLESGRRREAVTLPFTRRDAKAEAMW
jgi:predicted dehydrogenase